MFSIIILTYNEESSLKKCFKHIEWCDDIVVIDSFSNDKTEEIATKLGARVFKNKFKDFGDQRNFAIDNIKFKYEWVFHLDADEHFNLDLRNECINAIKNYEFGAFMIPSKTMFYGKWLKYSSSYPVFQMRFHKLGDARFIKDGHGQKESNLKKGIGYFLTPYEHFSFEKGLDHWLIKHIKYADDEAVKLSKPNFSILKIFTLDKTNFRRELKLISSYLPMRPLLRFIYFYFFKRGFLDGRIGYEYCKLQFLFEQMISIKTFNINNKNKI